MTKTDIAKTAKKIRKKYGTTNAFRLCEVLGITVDVFPMGTASNAIKGLIVRNSRCCTITINADLPEELQNIVCFHELGHYLLHHKRQYRGVHAFHDFSVMDNAGGLENEANLFVAEYLIDTDELLACLHEMDFFSAAAALRVPHEILAYKIQLLQKDGIVDACPVEVQSGCMGRI